MKLMICALGLLVLVCGCAAPASSVLPSDTPEPIVKPTPTPDAEIPPAPVKPASDPERTGQ